jgi:ribosomal protein S18 acetylase RimI-like enzyme
MEVLMTRRGSFRFPIIREMTIDDLAIVFHMGERLFTAEAHPTLHRTWDEYEVITHFSNEGELCLVAEVDEEILGFILCTIVVKRNSAWNYGYVIWLGVDTKQQKGHIGKTLFEEAKHRLRQMGARMLLMDTDASNKGAISFFKKQGFDKTRKHVYMSMNLDKE